MPPKRKVSSGKNEKIPRLSRMFSHSGTPLYGHPYITDSFVVPRGEGDSAYERGGDARRKF